MAREVPTVTTTEPAPTAVVSKTPDGRRGWQIGSLEILTVVLLVVVGFQRPISHFMAKPVLQNWMTVFIAVVTQALPFLVLGVLLSAAIAVFVPPAFFVRALPKRPALAVPVAGAAGAVLPGCECASVPVAGALVRRGVVEERVERHVRSFVAEAARVGAPVELSQRMFVRPGLVAVQLSIDEVFDQTPGPTAGRRL